MNLKLPNKPRHATMKWLPLNDLTIKVNFDAMFKPQICESCSGFVIRDNHGLVMGSGVVVNNHVADAFSAKALACVQALDFFDRNGFSGGSNGGGFKNNHSKNLKRDPR